MDAYQEIARIDQQIKGVHNSAVLLAGFKPRSADGWQKIRDQFPSLFEHEKALFCQRGAFQEIRDDAEAAKKRTEDRRKARELDKAYRAKCCPTCGRSAS